MPYIADLEKTGIPTVLVDLEDQESMVKQEALVNGVPNVRYVHASRTMSGPADVDRIMKDVVDGLLRPLTEKEKGGSIYNPPQDRVIFEGTYDEAEEIYAKTFYVGRPLYAPIATYTDGFAVKLPTEERVKEMLKGTSHRPDEMITYQSDRGAAYGASGEEG